MVAVVMGIVLASAAAAGSSAAPDPDRDPLERRAELQSLPSGAILVLPKPSVQPCRQFKTFEIEIEGRTEGVHYVGGNVGASWRAANRDWHIKPWVWQQPPARLGGDAVPTRARLTVPAPVKTVDVNLLCEQHGISEPAEIASDGDPFWGVRWRCDGSGCRPEVGFEVPRSLTRSPRRLRLCGSSGDTKCAGRDRDVRRALESQTTGLALAGESWPTLAGRSTTPAARRTPAARAPERSRRRFGRAPGRRPPG